MSSKDPAAPGFKQKAKREFVEFLWIAGYLAFFFCALSTYTMLLLRKYDLDNFLNYSFAIVNALVIGKVILIAQMAHLGRRHEAKPLYQSVIYKSFLFGVVVFAFHLVEEFVKRVIHGKPFGTGVAGDALGGYGRADDRRVLRVYSSVWVYGVAAGAGGGEALLAAANPRGRGGVGFLGCEREGEVGDGVVFGVVKI